MAKTRAVTVLYESIAVDNYRDVNKVVREGKDVSIHTKQGVFRYGEFTKVIEQMVEIPKQPQPKQSGNSIHNPPPPDAKRPDKPTPPPPKKQ